MSVVKSLGKVIDAKISKGSRDRRTKRMNGFNGLVIEFETEFNISDKSVVHLVTDSKRNPFNVKEVEVSGKNLLVRAVECGYWAHKLENNNDLDLRNLIGCDVELVEDSKILNQIRESSLLC